jgi:hypothetical protein
MIIFAKIKDFQLEGEGGSLKMFSLTMNLGKSGVEKYQSAKYTICAL